ncbi:MAG TPA: hypothetical protein VKG84_08085 [Candidatus Acidoferrales bacterium]|nr:hypothetical protein [Candidatus Acidoferrales bacterium]
MKRSGHVLMKAGAGQTTGRTHDLIRLFSKSSPVRRVERNFLVRLGRYVRALTVPDLHSLVVSGEFNEMFPALEDETSSVAPRRFEDLKAFDYDDWARRTKAVS